MTSEPTGSTQRLRRQSRQWIVLGALLVVAVVVGVVQFAPSRLRTAKASDPAADPSAAIATTGPSSRGEVASASPATWQVTWPMTLRRDLFDWDVVAAPRQVQRPAVAPAGPDAQAIEAQARSVLRLQGVMIDGQPMALINGRLLPVGAQVHDFEVCDIQPRGVTVRKDGVRVTLGL